MKHPQTGEPLNWSWGVDFFHVCEYLSLIAGALFGSGTQQAQSWFKEQRHLLRRKRFMNYMSRSFCRV